MNSTCNQSVILYLLFAYIVYSTCVYEYVVGSFDEHMKNKETIGIKPTISSLLKCICQKKNVTGLCNAFSDAVPGHFVIQLFDMASGRWELIETWTGGMPEVLYALHGWPVLCLPFSMQTRIDVLASSLLFQLGKLYQCDTQFE